jgi:hypothetical protein
MADDTQLTPPGGSAGYSAVIVHPGPEGPGRAILTAVLLVAAGAILGLIGGLVWAALAPRVVYQVYTLKPPTAYAVNPETNAFIAADGIYSFVAVGGGALLGLAGYVAGVRRYGAIPMIGTIAGALAAAFLAAWLGNVKTGGDSFNNTLSTSKQGAFLHAPIQLGSHGALAFWPVAAALVAGGLELLSFRRARQAQATGAGLYPPPYGRHRFTDGQPSGPWSAGPPPERYGMPDVDPPPAPGHTDT